MPVAGRVAEPPGSGPGGAGDAQAIDAEFRRLVEHELQSLEGSVATGPERDPGQAPGLLLRRAAQVHEGLLGHRGRFLLTSHDRHGEWLAYGWRDALRVVSDAPEDVAGIDEPAVWVQEERDFYADSPSAGRVAVGVSRVWVEQLVSSGLPRAPTDPDPNVPQVEPLRPVEDCAHVIGARVVIVNDDGSLDTDLRAVGPARPSLSGALALTVIAERDWYRWAERSYAHQPHPSLRLAPAHRVWAE